MSHKCDTQVTSHILHKEVVSQDLSQVTVSHGSVGK